MINCPKCGDPFLGNSGLGTHLWKKHEIASRQDRAEIIAEASEE